MRPGARTLALKDVSVLGVDTGVSLEPAKRQILGVPEGGHNSNNQGLGDLFHECCHGGHKRTLLSLL